MMQIQKITLLLTAVLSLVSCTNAKDIFESKTTYGISNSQWASMSKSERYAAKEAYREQQYLTEQRKFNAELIRVRSENTRLGQN